MAWQSRSKIVAIQQIAKRFANAAGVVTHFLMQFRPPKRLFAIPLQRLWRWQKILRFFAGLPRFELRSNLAMTHRIKFRLPETKWGECSKVKSKIEALSKTTIFVSDLSLTNMSPRA
ncbi:MAG: hypothetical protein IKI11_10160 [Neisseriaceae bacterium]|nr:hypothetical protein [Neisseriaceae bacterium]